METSSHYLQALEDQAQEQRQQEAQRLRFTRRLLWMVLPILGLLALMHALRRTGMASLAMLAMAFDLAGLAWLSVRPAARATVLRLLFIAFAALMAVEAGCTTSVSTAAGLQFLPLLCLAGLLMDSSAMGAALWFAGMGILTVAALGPGGVIEPDRLMLALLAVASSAALAAAWVWHRGLEAARAQLNQWQDALNRQWQERQELSRLLFTDQLASVRRLDGVLGLPDTEAWPLLGLELEHLGVLQAEARQRRQSLPEAPAERLDELSFQRQALRADLGIGMAVCALGLLIHLFTGRLSAVAALVSLLIFCLLLPVVGRPGQPRRWLLGVIVWGGLAAILGLALRGHDEGLYFMPLGILGAAMLLSFRSALAYTAGGLLALAVVGLCQGWDARLGDFALQAPVMAVVWLATLGVCAQSLQQRAHLLQGLQARSRDMARDLHVQRRLLGTLHHDLANLQTALLGVCQLGRAGLGEPGDRARVRRLVDRLGQLLEGGEELLLGEQPLPEALMGDLSLGEMAASMHELFNERLLAKRVGLNSDVPQGLRARGVASLLRDSVLSNLVSNAIKHSRPGSAVDIEGWIQEGQAALAVLDRGPGLSQEVLARLELGLEQPGGQGSAGEGGQGLGLLLAREQLQRMGGRLELRPRPGGGTMAIAWLRAA